MLRLYRSGSTRSRLPPRLSVLTLLHVAPVFLCVILHRCGDQLVVRVMGKAFSQPTRLTEAILQGYLDDAQMRESGVQINAQLGF
jgi:hypothetical protein